MKHITIQNDSVVIVSLSNIYLVFNLHLCLLLVVFLRCKQ